VLDEVLFVWAAVYRFYNVIFALSDQLVLVYRQLK